MTTQSKNAVLLQMLPDLIKRCHKASVDAGWYANTGVGYIEIDGKFGNVGEKVCLIHSEISEAMEGVRKNLLDTHLPHRLMVEVELADAVIRIADLLGFVGKSGSSWGTWFASGLEQYAPAENIAEALANIHRCVSFTGSSYVVLFEAIARIVALADKLSLDLPATIDEKMAYNLRRADHKLENRRAWNGKAF